MKQIPNELGYYESEFKTLTHADPSDYVESFFQRYMDHNRNMVPKPAAFRAIMKAEGEEKTRLENELRGHLASKCIAPDEEQVIHYHEWADPQCFFKPTLMHLYHPHWRLAQDRILDQFQRKNDTILVMFCGGSKPYSDNPAYRLYINAAKAGHFDFMVASLYPVLIYPFDASRLYPYVCSDWPHTSSPRLTEVYCEIHAQFTKEILERAGYRRVIYSHIGMKERPHIIELVKSKAPKGCRIIDLNEEEHLKDRICEEFPGFRDYPAILSVRWQNTKITREIVAKYCDDPVKAREALKLPKLVSEPESFVS